MLNPGACAGEPSTARGHAGRPSAHDVSTPPAVASVRGAGSPTVVFEAGGGEDSRVWSELEPEVRHRCEVRTSSTTAPDSGRSPATSPPYGIDREARPCGWNSTGTAYHCGRARGALLRRVRRDARGRDRSAHSRHVLVDANLAPASSTTSQIDAPARDVQAAVPCAQEAAPELARVMMPIIEAYPETVARLRRSTSRPRRRQSTSSPERTWVETPRRSRRFARPIASRRRLAAPASRLAEGSGHHVMRDRPEVVLDAIARSSRPCARDHRFVLPPADSRRRGPRPRRPGLRMPPSRRARG